jgi:hypothetical protein
VKRAELIIGKAYYMNKVTDWQGYHYGISESYAKTAESLSGNKVIVIETQLKTQSDKVYNTRNVLIQKASGKQVWVPLNHLRCPFIEAVKILTNDRRQRLGYDDRGNRYARHMARKMQKEQIEPAIKALCQEIERVTGEHIYRSDRIETLELNTLLTLTKALSVIKTELMAVAS